MTQCTPPHATPGTTSVEIPAASIKHFRLDNGLHLLVQEDRKAPVVSVQAWCRAGSITEGEYLGSGISHILEHMLFKGTERRGSSEIAQTIQSIGGYTNAYTSFDRTVYYIDAPSAGWKTALDVLSDAIFHSILPEDEYAREMNVVRREFAMGFDDPNRTLQKLLFSTAFQVHPYQYPVIGYLENFNRLTRDDVMSYYREHYVPNNMTFVVVGDVDAGEVKKELDRLTDKVPRATLPDVFIPDEPRQLGSREQHIPFPTDSTRMYLAWHIPGITHPDLYALDVLAILAGQGKSSRLHQRLVEEKGMVRSVGAFSYTPSESGLWAIAATMHAESESTRAEVTTSILEELSDFKATPPALSEVEKAKRMVLADQIGQMVTVSGKASSLGTSWFVANDTSFSHRYLEGLSRVTPEDISRVARKYLIDENRTVVSINPPGKESTVAPPSSNPAQNSESKPDLDTLPGNIPLVSVADPSLPQVTVAAIMHGGLLLEHPEQAGISHLTAQLLEKGTRTRSAEELALAIESLGGSLSVQSGNNSITVSISVLEPDLEEAIGLLSEIILEPAFREEEIAREKQKQLSDLALEKDQPMRVARNHVREALFQKHPYSRNTLGRAETVEAITREDILEFHQKIIARDRFVLSLAGKFPGEEARNLLASAFPANRLADATGLPPHPSDFGGTGETILIDTEKVQSIVQIGFPGIAMDSPDRVPLDLLDQALSDLASRLFIRIREQQGLAYFVGSSQLVGLDPGYFMFYAGTEPGAGPRVRDELLDEIGKIVADGLEPDEFERARAKLKGKKLLENQSAARQALMASLNVLYGLGIDYEADYQNQLDALQADDVHAAARKYFGSKNYVCVIVTPEENSPQNQN